MHSPFFVGHRLVRQPTGEITWYGKVVPNGRWLQRLIVGVALSGIQRIQPQIHRIEFTGNFLYTDIENTVGHQKGLNDVEKQNLPKHLRACKSASYVQLPEGKLTIAYRPYEGMYKPSCVIFTSHSRPALFSRLNQPNIALKVSSIEYAIDIFCINSEAVSDLFYLIRRYIYELITLQTTLGSYIINEFGIYTGNRDLRFSAKLISGDVHIDPDSVAPLIIKELWQRLRESHKLRVVKD